MKLNSIQFLRAIAALLVVYEHSMDVQTRFGKSWQKEFYHLNNFGCIGVDLFFVISGFIITYVADKYTGLHQGLHFLERRFLRINPVYYIVTAFFVGIYLAQMNVANVPYVFFQHSMIGSLIDSIIIIPTSGNIKHFSPMLIVGWTLAFEWLFYILFFVLIIGNVKRKALSLPCLILLLIGFGQLLKPEDLRLQFLTNPIMLEFVLGVIICQLYLHSKKIPVFAGVALLSIGIISYLSLIQFGYGKVWYYLDTISGTSSLNKFLLWGIPSSCIMAGCVLMEKNAQLTKLWSNKWMLLFGDASYSIYLVHYFIFGLLRLLYQKTGSLLNPDLMIWIQLIVAVAISVAFYKLVEKPLLKYFQNKTLWPGATSPRQKQISIDPSTEKIETVIS